MNHSQSLRQISHLLHHNVSGQDNFSWRVPFGPSGPGKVGQRPSPVGQGPFPVGHVGWGGDLGGHVDYEATEWFRQQDCLEVTLVPLIRGGPHRRRRSCRCCRRCRRSEKVRWRRRARHCCYCCCWCQRRSWRNCCRPPARCCHRWTPPARRLALLLLHRLAQKKNLKNYHYC